MSTVSIVEVDRGVVARFRWAAGGTGTMSLVFREGLVSELVIEFDQPA